MWEQVFHSGGYITNIYKRQTNLVKPDQLDFPILLIGAGGTGSWTGVALAKMGCERIFIVDFDVIEPHNTPSQAYLPSEIGKEKAFALNDMICKIIGKNVANVLPVPFQKLDWDKNAHFPVVICAIDSMDERIKLWDIIKKRNDVELFLDPRIGGELLRLYAVDPLDNKAVEFYESQLYPSSKADPLPCGSRQIIYTTMFTGALIANYVKKYAKKEPIRAETIIDFSTMNLV